MFVRPILTNYCFEMNFWVKENQQKKEQRMTP